MCSSTRRGRAAVASRLDRAILESLEKRTLFTGDIPTGYQLVKTIDVAPHSGGYTLAANTTFYFRARGTHDESGVIYDADFRNSSDTVTPSTVTYDVGIKLTGQSGSNPLNPDWGSSVDANHVYTAAHTTGGSSQWIDFGYVTGIEPAPLSFVPASGEFQVEIYAPAPLATPPTTGGGTLSSAPSGSNGGQSGFEGLSSTGVRYADGANRITQTDLSSDGFGQSWGITRSWSNASALLDTGRMGNGWVVSQLPYVQKVNGSTDILAVVTGTGDVHYFDYDSTGGVYVSRGYDVGQLTASGSELIYRDGEGNRIRFDDFSNATVKKRGQFKEFKDAGDNPITVSSYNGDGTIAHIERSLGSGPSTKIERFAFSYNGSALITNITLERSTDNRTSWTTIRQADYDYYGTGDGNGNQYDLKSVKIKDGSGTVLDTSYYRYYVSNTSPGYTGGIKGLFGPTSVARITAALGDPLSTSITDANIDDYADQWYEYDSNHRVSKVIQKASGDASTGGRGEFTYSYLVSGFVPSNSDFNIWSTRTTEHRSDGSENIVYSNLLNQPMLKVFKPSSGSDRWRIFYKYDSAGRLVLKANPSAVTNHYESSPDLLNDPSSPGGNYEGLADSAGLIETTTYYSTTTADDTLPGGVAGWQEYTKIQNGETGTPQPQTLDKYLRHDASGTSVYVPKEMTRYRSSGGSDPQTTTFSYTWQGSTHRVETMTINYPTVGYTQNGPGTTDSDVLFFDFYGRITWTKDADGFINATEYDDLTGAITKTITDVNTATSSNEPSGWTTPGGGGKHITTTMVIDALGRTTKVTDPNGNNSFIVYKDTSHEVRTYPGWTGSATTGPTTVVREDRANGYVETLTMTATPSTSGGEPTGAESIASLQTLARSYFAIGGQMTESRRYFSLSGLSYSTSSMGSAGTNYYATTYGYDSRGRSNRTLAPTGTIYRTVYDEQSRPVSSWVGTDDTPSSGDWSPSNLTGTNTKVISEYEYDGGAVGDSNITKVSSHPTGATSSTYDRVTRNWYDWRNRLIATKGGVQASESTDTQRLLNYYTYDNLGQVLTSETFDADNVTISTATAGVPDAPSSSLRRAKQGFDYDEQGRLFRSQTWSVDATNGNLSTYALNSYVWYDKRGNVIKTLAPGGLVGKTAYDGAGRIATSYSSDGGGDTAPLTSGTWGDADDVTSDKVLEQGEYTYDANANLILQANKQRFHNATGTGPLGYSDSPFVDSVTQGSWHGTLGSEAYSVVLDSQSIPAWMTLSTSGKSDHSWATSSSDPRATENGANTGRLAACWFSGTSFDVNVAFTDGKTHEVALYCLDWDSTSRAQTIEMIDANTSAVLATQQVSDFHDGKWIVFQASGDVKFRFTKAAGANAVLSALVVDPQKPLARTSYRAGYFDNANRLTATVDVGTNGGQRYARPGSAPSRSDTRLVTSYDYSSQGWLNNTTDPRGLVGLTDYDAAGRVIKTTENYVNGTPSNDDDRITEYTYDGMDHVLTLKAVLPSSAYQETKYVYDSTASANDVKSYDILTEIWYPNKSTGAASSSEKEVFAVNALGEQKSLTDRNGNVHDYSYDVLGRLTDDKVTTLGSGVDGYVRRLSYSYNTQGLLEFATSHSATSGGSVRNQIQREYNGLGQITKEYQNHTTTVNTSTTPKVQYAYSEMASGVNHSRLTKMTYPNGRILRYEYSSGIDNDISRLSFLADDSSGSVGTHLEEYSYLGVGTVVKRNRPQPGTALTYIKDGGDTVSGDAGDQYKGLDRFGRIIDQRWVNGSGDTDRFKYAYDRDSNALYRDNVMTDSLSGASDLDELYHADGASAGYDGFNRLTAFQRGKLSDANSDGVKDTVSTEARSQSWSLDQMGNWNTFTTNGTAATQTYNKQNQVISVSNGLYDINFDGNGNLSSKVHGYLERHYDYTYDAWNRLVKYNYVPNSDSEEPVERYYLYDALDRKQWVRDVDVDGYYEPTTRDLYWSTNWQVIEEKNDGPTEQWVYSPLYVDSPILRDRDYDQSSGNGLEERRYAQHDANFNTTSITNASGAVQERFIYDAYGTVTKLSSSWSDSGFTSTEWKYLYQGARYDEAAKLYDLRFRDYDPSLGRFLENDPIRQGDGPNMYQFTHSNPVNRTDPSGLASKGGSTDQTSDTSPVKTLEYNPARHGEAVWDVHDMLYRYGDARAEEMQIILFGSFRDYLDAILGGIAHRLIAQAYKEGWGPGFEDIPTNDVAIRAIAAINGGDISVLTALEAAMKPDITNTALISLMGAARLYEIKSADTGVIIALLEAYEYMQTLNRAGVATVLGESTATPANGIIQTAWGVDLVYWSPMPGVILYKWTLPNNLRKPVAPFTPAPLKWWARGGRPVTNGIRYTGIACGVIGVVCIWLATGRPVAVPPATPPTPPPPVPPVRVPVPQPVGAGA